MLMPIENKKDKAMELMKELDIYKPYIDGFKKEGNVCFFEGFGGYWTYQESELQSKINEIEKKYNCLVYAVTHTNAEFGECYDFLIITDHEEEWNTLVEGNGSEHYAFAYVWNKDYDYDSEFGTIVVRSFGGGIKRIG